LLVAWERADLAGLEVYQVGSFGADVVDERFEQVQGRRLEAVTVAVVSGGRRSWLAPCGL
jgi:hypothetical protein